MTYIVENAAIYKMSDILDSPIDSENVYLTDIIVDEKRLDGSKKLKNQTAAGYIFRISISPNIKKVVEKKILGYKLSVESRVPFSESPAQGTASGGSALFLPPMDINFYDDFGDVDTGEKDFLKLIENVTAPQPVLVDEGSLSPAGKSIGFEKNVYDGKSVEKSLIAAKDTGDISEFFNSSMACLNAGESPDDLAELALPSFKIDESGFYQPVQKNKNFLFPRPGDVFSLKEDRISKMKSLYPQDGTELAAIHEFTSIVGSNDDVVARSSVVYASNPYFYSVREVEVPAYMMASGREIYFTFVPIVHDSNGDVPEVDDYYVEKESHPSILKVNYSSQVNALLEPEVPPSSRIILDKPGKISYIVNKNDPTTESVTVILTYVNKATGEIKQGGYNTHRFQTVNQTTEVGLFSNCLNREPYIPIVTTTATSDGATLSSQTVGILHPSPYSKTYLVGESSIVALNTRDGVSVRFFSNSERFKRITLYREDMRLNSLSDNRIEELESTANFIPFFEFLDETALSGKTYRYFAKAQLEESSPPIPRVMGALHEVILPSDALVDRKVDTDRSELYDLSIKKVNTKSGSIFTPSVKIDDSDFSFFVNDIIASGFKEDFIDVIKNNRDKLADLAYFTVERIDKVTGERKAFHALKNNESFQDHTASVHKSYIYVFRLALINMEAALIAASLLGSDVNKIESSVEGQNAIKKLFESFTKVSGVIPSPSEALKSSSGDLIQGSLTGAEIYAETNGSLKKIAPTITKSQEVHGALLADEGYSGEAKAYKITWKANNDVLSEIDSFYVYCKYGGATTVIKTVAVVPGVSTYTALEFIYYHSVGQKEYYVKAKYNDNKLGPASNSVFITKEASIPAEHIGRSFIVTKPDLLTDSSKLPMAAAVNFFGSN